MKSFKNKYVVAPNEEIERLVLERLIRLGYDLGVDNIDDFIYNNVIVEHPIFILINDTGIDGCYDEQVVLYEGYKKVPLEEFFSTEWGEGKKSRGELTVTFEGELPPVKSNTDTVLSFKEYDRTVEIRYDAKKEPVAVEIFAQAIMDLVSASGYNPTDVFEELQCLIEEELG